eukprot:TRINITY_DN3320_c0_g1_i1.p1 TRINITY_DN3320_c0_g1~~TRINITY_DN3320_c0_g1_i1.p1  ORF type:complete len:584 (+),score=132.57 TRINITY_DN3320_c0_g1_i1:76-1827(+)
MVGLSAYEELTTSPIDKIFKHHIIPWKFCLHIAIIICTSLYIAIPGTYDNVFLGKNAATFRDFFIGDEYIEDIFEPSNRDRAIELMDVDTLINFTSHVVEQYYLLESETAENYQFIRDPTTNEILQPVLTISQYKSMNIYSESGVHYFADLETNTTSYQLNENDFIGDWLRQAQDDHDYFALFDHMDIEFKFNHFHNEPDFGYRNYDRIKVEWSVKFKFRSRLHTGIFSAVILAENKLTPQDDRSFFELMSWTIGLSGLMILLSFLWLIAIMRYILKRLRIYYKTSNRGIIAHGLSDDESDTINEMPLLAFNPDTDVELDTDSTDSVDPFDFMHVAKLAYSDNFKIVDVWTIFDLLGATCLLWFAITELVAQLSFFFASTLFYTHFMFRLFLLGSGSFFIACSFLQYFRFYPSLSYLVLSITKGLPTMTKFLVGSMPLFYGYALFATAAFSPVAPRFEDIGQSLITQFCVLNGDDMLATFTAINQAGVFPARAYLYSYVIIFVWATLQIFIMIMEEAFCEATEELEIEPEDFQNDAQNELIHDLADKNDVERNTFEEIDNLINEIRDHEQDQVEQLRRLKVLK